MRNVMGITALLLTLNSVPRMARGDDWTPDLSQRSPVAPMILAVPGQLAGLALNVVDITATARDLRPSNSVLAWSYLVAALNLGFGGWALGEGIGHGWRSATGIGISGLALGAAGIVTAALAQSQRERPAVAVVPLIAPDGAGGLVAGVGLQLTRF